MKLFICVLLIHLADSLPAENLKRDKRGVWGGHDDLGFANYLEHHAPPWGPPPYPAHPPHHHPPPHPPPHYDPSPYHPHYLPNYPPHPHPGPPAHGFLSPILIPRVVHVQKLVSVPKVVYVKKFVAHEPHSPPWFGPRHAYGW